MPKCYGFLFHAVLEAYIDFPLHARSRISAQNRNPGVCDFINRAIEFTKSHLTPLTIAHELTLIFYKYKLDCIIEIVKSKPRNIHFARSEKQALFH